MLLQVASIDIYITVGCHQFGGVVGTTEKDGDIGGVVGGAMGIKLFK